jgi:predicted RNA-binding Zn-ribbon protein involved in translation (DUF1610 family)
MKNESTPPDRGALSKATLFCLACDRTAPIDDAWSLANRDGRTDLLCPDCGAVIVSQPDFDADGSRRLVTA